MGLCIIQDPCNKERFVKDLGGMHWGLLELDMREKVFVKRRGVPCILMVRMRGKDRGLGLVMH